MSMEPKEVVHKIKELTLKSVTSIFANNPGESIFEEDWTHLIILDNCRYDVFLEEFTKRKLPGMLNRKLSLGSWTGEFLLKNFREKHEDIIFISANPFSAKYLNKSKFFKIIHLWKTNWNDKYNTVLPNVVYLVTLKEHKKHPDKRLIVHFLQPHHPYLVLNFEDKTMRVIRDSINRNNLETNKIQNEKFNEVYLSLIYGQFHLKKLIWAYKENLKIVMPYVEMLLHKLPGKIAVTSDHGELFGEYVTKVIPIKVYGHGIGRNSNLITVPWWIIKEEDKQYLRPIKEIKKEIALIESRFDFRIDAQEKLPLKKVIGRLKVLEYSNTNTRYRSGR